MYIFADDVTHSRLKDKSIRRVRSKNESCKPFFFRFLVSNLMLNISYDNCDVSPKELEVVLSGFQTDTIFSL